MKLKIILFSLILCSLAIPSLGQKPGFYGKRLILQLGGTGHYNLLRNVFNDNEQYLKNFSSSAIIKSNKFSGGLYGYMGYQITDQIAFGIDVQKYYSNKSVQSWNFTQINNQYYNYVQLNYEVLRIMPRLEIATSGALAPIGLVHVLGVGMEIVNPDEKEVVFFDNGASPRTIKSSIEKIDNTKVITFLYGLESRVPLSKNLGFVFGGYAHLNTNLGIAQGKKSQITQEIGKSRAANLFSMRFGLQIAL